MAKTTALSTAGAVASSLAGSASGSLLQGLLQTPTRSEISINGEKIADAKKEGGKITTNYNQSKSEKALSDYTNANLLKGLENINVFSDEVKRDINRQIEAYKQQGLETLNETYTPMFRELKADIASRFGNFDNSVFMDNLNDLEKNRAKALEDLTQEIMSKQSELYQTELENRYNYLEALTTSNQNLYSNMLEFLKLASSNVK